MNAQAFTLTKALDEADHTSPAPFRWHLHGADSLTRTQWVKWEKKKKTVGFYRLWNTAAMIKNKSNSLQEVKVTEDVCLLHHCQKCYRSPFDVKLWHQVGLTKAKSVNLHPYENERQKKRNTRAWGQKENCHDSSTTALSHIQSKSNRVMSCSHTLEEP